MSRAVSPLTSVVLDSVRFALAFAVAAGHWTQPHFQEGWRDLSPYAVAAVGAFFVLSGFTIRLLTPEGEAFEPAAFFVERLSRLWSVALPAVLLTVVCDSISYQLDTAYYLRSWGQDFSTPLLRIAVNVLFVGEFWGRDIELFSNSLFWSLGYEAGFYFLYGVFRSTRGYARYGFTLAACAMVGPNIVLMLVPWLGGVLLHDLVARVSPSTPRASTSLFMFGTAGAVTTSTLLFACRDALSRFSLGVDTLVRHVFHRADTLVGDRLIGARLTPARIEGDLIVGAGAFFVVFSFAMLAIRGFEQARSVSPRLVRFGRRLGDFTFPLYLFHFPVFVLLGATGAYDRGSSLQKGALFLAVGAGIYAAVPLTTSLKWSLRSLLRLTPRRAVPDP